MKSINVLMTATIILVMTSFAAADVPQMINYQGRLTDDQGEPMDTTVSMEFAIYDDSTGGTSIWSETHPSVTVIGGLFSVVMGTLTPIDDSVFNSSSRYIGIQVGENPEIEPRTRLITVPYAYRVSTVDGASGGTVTGQFEVISQPGAAAAVETAHPGTPKVQIDAGLTVFPTPPGRQSSLHINDGVGNPVIDLDGLTTTVGIGTNQMDANLHVNGDIYTLGGDGDANLNLAVEVSDAIMLVNYLAETITLTDEQYANGDMDGDGRVTYDDVAILISIIFGAYTKSDAIRRVHSAYGASPDLTLVDAFYVRGDVGVGIQIPLARMHVDGDIYTLGGDGDADLSNIVDVSDVIMLINYLAESTTLTEEQFANGDLDGDGRVTNDDVAILILMTFGAYTKNDALRRVHSSYGASPDMSAGDAFYVRGSAGIGTQVPAATMHVNGDIYTLGGDGDADLNQSVNISDIVLLINYLNESATLSAEQYANGDVDGDGRVTSDDAAVLVLMIFGAYNKSDALRRIHSSYGASPDMSVPDAFFVRGSVGIGIQTPEEKLHVFWDTNVDAELGRGTTDTDITYLSLRNENGTKCYIYPNAAGNGIVVTTTEP